MYRIFLHMHRVYVIHILEGNSYIVLSYFHWTRTSTPFVFSLQRFVTVRVMMNVSCYRCTYSPQYPGIGHADLPLHSLDVLISGITMGIMVFVLG